MVVTFQWHIQSIPLLVGWLVFSTALGRQRRGPLKRYINEMNPFDCWRLKLNFYYF